MYNYVNTIGRTLLVREIVNLKKKKKKESELLTSVVTVSGEAAIRTSSSLSFMSIRSSQRFGFEGAKEKDILFIARCSPFNETRELSDRHNRYMDKR